jgi:hypothetical protein
MRGELKLYVVLGALLLSFILLVTAGDVIISPLLGTPNNGSSIQGNSIFVNISANTTLGNVSVFLNFNNSLVSWWRMDDANSTHVFDYLGRNNGTIVNAVQTDSGYMGKGFEFDSTDSDYIDLGNKPEFNISKEITISVWVKKKGRTLNVDTSTVIGKEMLTNTGYILEIHDDDAIYANLVRVTLYGVSPSGWRSNRQIIQNEWCHIVITFNGTNTILYINGTVDKNEPSTGEILTGSDTLKIGYSRGSGNQNAYFNGTIDDVLIFNRSLTANEIAALYANQSLKYLSVTFANLSEETHDYTIYTQDTSGDINSSTQIVTLDYTSPNLSIISPLNQTYTSFPVIFNVTASDANGISACWYSMNNGINNISLANTSGNHIFIVTVSSISEGSRTVNFYCNDSAGNINGTESVYLTIDIPTTATELVATAETLGFGAPTYYPNQETLAEGYEVFLGKKFKVNMGIGIEKHQLVVNSIQNGSVNITISSDPITFILQAGQTQQVDLNSDNIYDLSVFLKSISGMRANLVLTAISEVQKEPVTVKTEPSTSNKSETITPSNINIATSPRSYVMLSGFFVFLVVIIVGFIIFRKNKLIPNS